MKVFSVIIFLLIIVKFSKSEVVCSEDELVKEIKEDLADNNKLDCLRESLPVLGETVEQKEKRIKANWTGDCSFESESNGESWVTRLQKNYMLFRNLIDVDGKPYTVNKPEQADMCEIIRSLIGNGAFPSLGNDVSNINEKFTEYIDCPGDEGSTEVCAANPFSFADKRGWYIFLDGKGISINNQPKYILANSLNIDDQ